MTIYHFSKLNRQLFYDCDNFMEWVRRCREVGMFHLAWIQLNIGILYIDLFLIL